MRIAMLLLTVFLVQTFFIDSARCQAPVAASPSVQSFGVPPPSAIISQTVLSQTTAVPVSAAPPAWFGEFIDTVSKLPMVGPIVSKVFLWAGILGSIMTALVAFLLALTTALSSVMNTTGLTAFADKLEAFKNGQIMYWLMTLSLFNAKKPAPGPGLADTVVKS